MSLATVSCTPAPASSETPTATEAIEIARWTVDGSPTPITLPAHIDGPREPTTIPLRTHVELPPAMRDTPLTLAFPWVPARCVLDVDGVPATEIDPSLFTGYRASRSHAYRIVPRGRSSIALRTGAKRVDQPVCVGFSIPTFPQGNVA